MKYQRLLTDCQSAIAEDNLEKCFELIRQGFNLSIDISNDLNLLEGNFNRAKRERMNNLIDYDKYSQERSKIANGLTQILGRLKEDDLSSSDTINDIILIIACKHSPTNWRKLFNEAYFSHVEVIEYQQDVPEKFKNADVIVFDDLGCALKNHVHMGRYIRELPGAHILYVGKENPLEDSNPAAYERSANANSLITVPARLRELLEYRKIFDKNNNAQ